jgi:hypothetical protein
VVVADGGEWWGYRKDLTLEVLSRGISPKLLRKTIVL